MTTARRDPRHDSLFKPVRFGPKTVRNRFYQVLHCTGFGVFKTYSHAAHRAIRAEGAWAGVCTEFVPVSWDSDEASFVPAQLIDGDDLACLALMADAVQDPGALAGIGFTHAGEQASTQGSREPSVAPPQIMSDSFTYQAPKAMEKADIFRVQEDWARATRQAASAGFNIVYAYGGTGHLPTQFLSPAIQ